jgi:ankyrin repeat protein
MGRFILFFILLIVNCGVYAAEIHEAAENGDLETVKRLISQNPALLEAPDREGKTPLHYAAAKGHLNVVEFLVSKGANVNARNSSGATPLYLAKGFGRKEVVEFLTKHGGSAEIIKPKPTVIKPPSKDIKLPTESSGKSIVGSPVPVGFPLIEAIKATNIGKVELLLKTDANLVKVPDNTSMAPIHYAAELGNLAIVELLAKNGADLNSKTDKGWTPLHFAVMRSHTNVVKFLLENKVDVNQQTTAGITPLMLASGLAYNPEIVKLLLQSGANVNLKDQFGNTALSLVASVPDEFVVSEMLIKAGASVNVRDIITGFTPLHHAAARDNAKLAKILISAGADVNALTTENDTPLIIAKFENATNVEKVLIQNGGKEPPRRNLTPTEKSLISYYKNIYDTILKGDATEIRKMILSNRVTKTEIQKVFLKNADVAWSIIEKAYRDEDVAWASVAKNSELKNQLVDLLRGDARPGDYYILETSVMSPAARIALQKGYISKDVPILTLKIRRRGETATIGEFFYVNNRWYQMPPLTMVFPELR